MQKKIEKTIEVKNGLKRSVKTYIRALKKKEVCCVVKLTINQNKIQNLFPRESFMQIFFAIM